MSMDQEGRTRGQVLYADVRQGADGAVVSITCNEWLHDAPTGSVYPMTGGSTWDFALGGTVVVDKLQQLIAALWRSKLCSEIELRNAIERGQYAADEAGEHRGKIFVTIGEHNPVGVLNILLEISGGSQWPVEEEVDDTILEPALRDAANRALFPKPRPRT